MHTQEEKLQAIARLLGILDDLREKCPWDRKQTNKSLRENTIEETYELCDAIIKDDNKEICKELGDVLLHVMFYAKIGEEQGAFDLYDVCQKQSDKLVYRHPHVYGDAIANDAGSVLKTWEQRKLTEKDGNKSVLSGVPNSLPSLIKAYRIQEKAANVGFDWQNKEDVWHKIKEEISEYEAELISMDKDKMEEEFGDILFSLINMARLYHIKPDTALEKTCHKFISRFNYVEAAAKAQNKSINHLSLAEMDNLWNEAKTINNNIL